MINREETPLCQSCALPMSDCEMFGTHADGTTTKEFCIYCYQDGQFKEPTITMQEMIDKCVLIMCRQKIMPEEKARVLMTETIPDLKRWKSV